MLDFDDDASRRLSCRAADDRGYGLQGPVRGGPEIESESFHGRLVSLDGREVSNSAVWLTVTAGDVRVDLHAGCDYHIAPMERTGGGLTLTQDEAPIKACSQSDRRDLAQVVSLMKRGALLREIGRDVRILGDRPARSARFETVHAVPLE